MAIYDVTYLGKREVAKDTMEFRFTKPANLEYRAGQFLDIILPATEGAEKSTYVHGFSYVSAPFENEIKIATRMRGSAFKKAIKALADNTPVKIDANFGDFTLQKNESVPAVFVIGGIGITPVKSMLEQATHDQTGHQLTLIYANRTPADAAYTNELEALAAKNPHFTFVPVYTNTQGHVNAATIKQHVPDVAKPRYYISGPEGMVKAMRQLLVEVGADEDNIRTEEFEGY